MGEAYPAGPSPRAHFRDNAGGRGYLKIVLAHWLRIADTPDRRVPLHLAQATVGHSDLRVISRYAHARPGDSSANHLPRMSVGAKRESTAQGAPARADNCSNFRKSLCSMALSGAKPPSSRVPGHEQRMHPADMARKTAGFLRGPR
jgi:hypothetical protein